MIELIREIKRALDKFQAAEAACSDEWSVDYDEAKADVAVAIENFKSEVGIR